MADLIFNLAGLITLGAIVLSVFRMIAGPTVIDRLIALDVMTVIVVVLIAFMTIVLKRSVYIDVALVYALMTFVGGVAIARHIEGGM